MSINTTKQKNSLSENWRIRQVVVEIKDGIGDVSVCPADVHVVIINHDYLQEQQQANAKKGDKTK